MAALSVAQGPQSDAGAPSAFALRSRPSIDRSETAKVNRRPQLQLGAAWPKFHGNLLNTGLAANGGSNGALRWSYATSYLVESSPAIAADGTLYIGSNDGYLYSINSSTGALNWRYGALAAIASSPAIGSDGTIYFGSNDKSVYSINPTTHIPNWSYQTGGAVFSSPAIGSDGTVYVGSTDSYLYAINPSTGQPNWSFQTGDVLFSSPAVGPDGAIYIASFDNNLYSISPTTHTASWTFTAGGGIFSSPAFGVAGGNNALFVGSSDDNLYAVNASTGHQIWMLTTGGPVNSSPAIGPDGTVYVGSQDDYVYAVNPSTGATKWTYKTGGSVNSSPAIGSDGTVYVGSTDGKVYALNPSNGQVLWSYATGGQVFSSPAIGPDGAVYVGSYDYSVYALGTEVSTVAATSLSLNPNVVASGSSSTATVTLASAAPTGGDVVSLISSDPSAVVPPFVTVPSGATSATFTISTNPSTTFASATITATSGGANATAVLIVQTSTVASLTLNPSTIIGGNSSTATVTLSGPAPVGGTVVTIANQWPTYVTVPATCTVPAGATSTTFTVSTPQMYMVPFTNLITATVAGSSQNATLTVATYALEYVTVNPTSIAAGGTSTGTVTLWSAAPTGGWTIYLLSGNPSFVGLPASVTVPAGATTANFTITVQPNSPSLNCLISAHDPVIYHSVSLAVTGDSIASVSVNPTSIIGGGTSTGAVTLKSAAPTGGWPVNLSVGVPSILSVPATVTVPAGATSTNFTITAVQTGNSYTSGVYATDGNSSQSTSLTIVGYRVVSLTLSPSTILGGTSSTATVTLSNPAPTGGMVVNMTNQYPTYVSCPATVTVAAGATSATFTVSTSQLYEVPFTNIITASVQGTSQSATLTVSTYALATVTFSPPTVVAGNSSTGTVSLWGPAPVGGWTISLVSTSPTYVSVPPSITVPAGATSATFLTTTSPNSPAMSALISAHDSVIYHSGNLNVIGDSMTGLSLNPTTIGGGGSSTGTVTLAGPAPSGGWAVRLAAGVPSIVNLPSTVTVPAGATSVTFPISAKQTSTTYTSGIYATDANSAQSASLTIVGDQIVSLTLNPTSIGGGGTSTGTITLRSAAPYGGWTVNLSAGVPSIVSVPATVVVPAGSINVNFTISAKETSATYTSGIYATDGNSAQSAALTVVGDAIASLTVNPSSIGAGSSTTGTITLRSAAPYGGWTVGITVGIPSLVTVPATVVVPAGATSVNFTISTKITSGTYTSGVYASDGNSGQSASVTFAGDQITGLSVSPASVTGGSGSTGTITLKSPAPVGGWLVSLSVGVPSIVGVPATVLIPAGSSSATFPITTKAVSSNLNIGIYAVDGTSGGNTALAVTH